MTLCIAAVSLFCFGCSGKEATEAAPTMTVQVAAAERATIERKITADAVLYPVHQAAIVPKIGAPVSKFYAERGAHVRAGQLLAELESKDLAAAVTENRGNYQQAEATYQTAVNAGLPEELNKAELDLTAAKQALDAQQKVFDSRRMLYQQGAIPRKDLTDAATALTQARNNFDIAQQHYQVLKKVGHPNEIKAAEGGLTAAKGRYDAAEAQLSYAQIRSPIDGVVTDRPLYPGEMASPGSPLIIVMDLSRVVARAHVSQPQAALLKVGDEARLSVPGMSQEVPAKVTVVSPALDPGSTTVEVWAEAANPQERLQPGTSVRISFVAETVKDALVIPATALVTSSDGGASVILAGADGKPQSRAVKLGIHQGDKVQITDGLQPGDHVVTQGAFELAQEDPEVLAKTKLQIAAPTGSAESAGPDRGKDSAKDSSKP
ncbi:MAG TPA: efflux RND transporter periplasmic adaptor subunit [Terriglobia bacterium]